jgi:hypothetical protein
MTDDWNLGVSELESSCRSADVPSARPHAVETKIDDSGRQFETTIEIKVRFWLMTDDNE